MADIKYIQQFKKGSYEMILLCLIAKKETYGYEIMTELNETGGKIFGYAREGTIYPMLYRLEGAGLVKCRLAPSHANGGSKKYYSLTDKGRETMHELISFWRSYTVCVDSLIDTEKGLEARE
jgi:PadR family transcriptional regulator PadR